MSHNYCKSILQVFVSHVNNIRFHTAIGLHCFFPAYPPYSHCIRFLSISLLIRNPLFHLAMRTLGVTLWFVNDYIPFGLTPQNDVIPVIQKGASDLRPHGELTVLCQSRTLSLSRHMAAGSLSEEGRRVSVPRAISPQYTRP